MIRRCVGLPAFVAALVLATSAVSAGEHFPRKHWWAYPTPERAGWSSEPLKEAEAFASTIDTAAVMIVHDGRVVYQWGDTERAFMCHSMRKSILSALYGIYVEQGVIDLDKTMADLGIDDKAPSLSDVEKRATVRDLLKARSGIYHAALYETAGMTASKPPRGSHEPGAHWHYNNWDFNALGSIFDNEVEASLFTKFEEDFAVPLGMQDFEGGRHTDYHTGDLSVHPAYPFQLSARDLARFGLMMARNGRWRGGPVVPEAWVRESTVSYSDAGRSGGYGYMWWVAVDGRHLEPAELPEGAYSARGAGGHYVLVVPGWDVVIVHRVNTFVGDSVSSREFGELLAKILEAAPPELTVE
jgi:CubicO group peptidase (beta-lactamase class C family)